ncbi:MAG: hypothetical protein DMG81_12335 [Acidobacteria bacterium]|nr:MAG: hypothetical protein DMG81_12335 [Acidobacteriota bacterium]
MLPTLRTLGWLICTAYATIPGYWLLIHPRAAYWRSRTRNPFRRLLPLWALMVVALLMITARFRGITLYQSAWAWVPAAILFASGISLYKAAGASFTLKQLQGHPELSPQQEEQHLVTSGIHARVRHPIYLAHFQYFHGRMDDSGRRCRTGTTFRRLLPRLSQICSRSSPEIQVRGSRL